MENKKILFLTLGKENLASSRIRAYGYRSYLKNAGFDCRYISYTTSFYHRSITRGNNYLIKTVNKLYGYISIFRLLWKVKAFDVIFIQRVLLSRHIFRLLRTLNPNVIFDFDDAVYLTDRYTRNGKSNKFLKRFDYIAKNSKVVITTQSFFNLSYAKSINKNVITLTTPVDTKRYFPMKREIAKEGVVIGWIGSPSTTHYLNKLKNVFHLISKKYPYVRFEFIGAEPFKLDGIKLIFKDWSIESEIEDLQNFDIGIMPLEDDEWSRNKYYKLLQYFAVGIPAVVSAVGICRDIVDDGVNGFLAKDEDAWINKISMLIENPELRKRLGENGREKAVSRYSYEANSPILINLFQEMARER